MTGVVSDTSISPDGQLDLISPVSSTGLVTPASWERTSGFASINISQQINPSLVAFQFKVRNQAAQQLAPIITVSVVYKTNGGSFPNSVQNVPWTVSLAPDPTSNSASRSPPVAEWNGDSASVSEWKKVLYIRSPSFRNAAIGQSSALPGALNTIGITLNLNVELIPRCKPRIILSNLQGACIPSSPDVELASDSNSWHKNFSSASKKTGYATFISDGNSLALNAYTFSTPSDADPLPSATVLANTNYVFTLNVNNPIQGQDAPIILARVAMDSVVDLPTPTVFIHDNARILGSVNLINFTAGDAAALKVYSPVFLRRYIQQAIPCLVKSTPLQ